LLSHTKHTGRTRTLTGFIAAALASARVEGSICLSRKERRREGRSSMPCGEHATNVKGPAHALVSTSPHAPRLRPRLLSLVAIRFTILITLSAITGATVFTIQPISPTVSRRKGPATYTAAPPTTDIAVTFVRAHLERILTALHCLVDRWRRKPR
jgi:hypothetical protein